MDRPVLFILRSISSKKNMGRYAVFLSDPPSLFMWQRDK